MLLAVLGASNLLGLAHINVAHSAQLVLEHPDRVGFAINVWHSTIFTGLIIQMIRSGSAE